MATTHDPGWPAASSLLQRVPTPGREHVALVGVPTYATSVSQRSSHSTPDAIRRALERYSTWSFEDNVDLASFATIVDYGNVVEPDAPGGSERVAARLAEVAEGSLLTVVLGGDNAATWHSMRALAAGHLEQFGLITLDAHLDLRDGRSNGSPVRQLIEEGLDGHYVVQLGVGEFSNSSFYARRALDAGITTIGRSAFFREDVATLVRRAVDVAGASGRPIYVDIDLDVADRAVVPGCPGAAPGGLGAYEVRQFAREIVTYPGVKAIDITEIDVGRDSADERTVRLAAVLLLEIVAGLQGRST
ncbi:MAG: arginase family protein [Acidimicrobiales bacterium]